MGFMIESMVELLFFWIWRRRSSEDVKKLHIYSLSRKLFITIFPIGSYSNFLMVF